MAKLQSVFSAEDNAGRYLINTFRGQNVLLDSFQGFFIETLQTAIDYVASHGWPKDRINYPIVMAYFSTLFRRCRACEILYIKGYPLDGYALMRDIKDRVFMLAGVAHNWIKLAEVVGAIDNPPADREEYKKRRTKSRKDAEHRIAHRLMGKTSGLSLEVQQDLALWDEFFNVEVHGGSLSLAQEIATISKGRVPQIGPAVDQDAFVMYMNRSAELGWLIVRLLPFLQVSKDAFGNKWQHKRQVLDASFRFMVEALGTLGKRLGPSFITMVDTNFLFREPFYYSEADGTA